jgi:hypothetical protein
VKVTVEMNESINLPFTAKEVERALFMMEHSKAQVRTVLMQVPLGYFGAKYHESSA